MRRPLTAGSVVFALALLSAFSAVPGSAASSCSEPKGSVLKLSSRDLANPTVAVTCQARLALQGHSVVTAITTRPGLAQLGRVLGIQLPEVSAVQVVHSVAKSLRMQKSSGPSPAAAQVGVAPPSNGVTTVFQGVHLDRSGVTRVYEGFAAAGGAARAAGQFSQWISGQTAALTTSSVAPSSQAWTQLYSTTISYSDPWRDSVYFGISDDRLNDINSGGDWYSFATQLQTAPYYLGCSYSSVCGPFTSNRNVSLPGASPLSLSDYGPTGTITGSSVGYSVGGGLSAGTDVGVGVNAGFSQSWDQPSVTTYDQSNYSNIKAAWQENFGAPDYTWWPFSLTPPPATSTGSFQSYQAAIFKANEGTNYFGLTAYASSTFREDTNFHWCNLFYLCWTENFLTVNMSIGLGVQPPVFSVSPTAISVSRGSSGTLYIQALVPGSSQGLAWDVTNIPSWLTITSLSGSGAGSVVVTVPHKTPIGSVANLNFNTSPAFAAPSVEHGPIIVPLTVVR